MLNADDFAAFFQEVHGYPPFPWQKRLLACVAARGEWPDTLDLPTGSGKTAAIDIALFHLALEADHGRDRHAPTRIAFVVDRRLVVDDAFRRARRLETALVSRVGGVSAEVAERLKVLSGDGPPLIARRLRGGIPREGGWARTPSQPTVLCSTVDQIGSRLLFRGYGVSDAMKPVHAGLIGSDCLILLDEAHLAEPFWQTLNWVKHYRGEKWRKETSCGPWGFARLSATPGEKSEEAFSLDSEDRANPILRRRLEVGKPTVLVSIPKPKHGARATNEIDGADGESDCSGGDLTHRASAIVEQVRAALEHFEDARNGASKPAIGVIVNRVARAREVLRQLDQVLPETMSAGAVGERPKTVLLIGPARPADRDDLVGELTPIRTRVWEEGETRTLDKPIVLIATQCIEVGVDIDLDALISEAAPLDSLRQRFGRLNRAGRAITPYAAIIADRADVSTRVDDPVYGKAIKPTWDYLNEWSKEAKPPTVDLGINAMGAHVAALSAESLNRALSEKPNAPVLLPAHLDLLSYTSPIPAADPDVALYLHGPARQPDSITIVWRADVRAEWKDQDLIRLLTLVPPRSREAIQLPVWAVQCWLQGREKSAAEVADVPTRELDERGSGERRVFRWKGDDVRSRWISPSEVRAGDTVIVPASYGGVDAFGWNPEYKGIARDVAHKAAMPFARHRFAVRVAPGLTGKNVSDEALAGTLAGLRAENSGMARRTLLDLELPVEVRDGLRWLDDAKGRPGRPRVVIDFALYGENERGEPRGVVLLAPFGVKLPEAQQVADHGETGSPNSTEDDMAGSISGFQLSLDRHSHDVEGKALEFAERAGLPAERVADLELAGFLHDQGKRDPRFQAWLHFDDPLGFDDDDGKNVLAKSGRTLPPAAREKAGLPERWRHEALSVRLARTHARMAQARDPELVLWLVGSHHGYGRPFFPHRDPKEKAPEVGPQSLAFDWNGLDWPSLFARLRARYGVWELARMEAILRLADHRASEEAGSVL